MNRLNTIFLGVIAAVLVGGAVVWIVSAMPRQPTLAESVDRLEAAAERVREVNRVFGD